MGAEVRFHADRLGLVDVVEGRIDVERFLVAMRRHWFAPVRPDGGVPGLRRVCPQDRFDAAMAAFEETFPLDRHRAANALIHALLDPVANDAGCRAWVECTPPNIAAAPGLASILPSAAFVHCVRDGADVACSVAKQRWGPDSPREGLLWWYERFRDAALGERAVSGRVHRVHLERLVSAAGESEYQRLLEFLGLSESAEMRRFFEQRILISKAHTARWRRDLPAHAQPAFALLTTRLIARLDAAALTPPPTTVVSSDANAWTRSAVHLEIVRWRLASRVKACNPRNRLLRLALSATLRLVRFLDARVYKRAKRRVTG